MSRQTVKYTIDYYENSEWYWAGDGDTDNGTTAQLPEEVYDFADSAREGEITVEGELYRVTHLLQG
jgi:hypothetical protein